MLSDEGKAGEQYIRKSHQTTIVIVDIKRWAVSCWFQISISVHNVLTFYSYQFFLVPTDYYLGFKGILPNYMVTDP